MKKYLKAIDVANNARMNRSLHSGTILIVEGKTDIRVYERFISETHCIVIPAYGKDNAIEALAILEKNSVDGVLTIVDADFWRLDGIKSNSTNLLLTDTHDLETMLLSSDALEKVLSEFGSIPKIKKLGKPVQELLLESGLSIGIFRWLSSPTKDNLSLKFKDLYFGNFVFNKTLSIELDKLIKEVNNHNPHKKMDIKLIKSKIIKIKINKYDPWQVCSGHDLIEILSIGLKYLFGNHRAKNISTEAVDGILRVSYEYSFFSLTKLHKSIINSVLR